PVGDWAAAYDRPVENVNDWAGTIPPHLMDQCRRGYYAQITHIDFQIGRLVGLMRRMDVGPTAFVFTSDHGEMLGDHGLWRKTYAYEGSARVPMIVTVPGAEGPTTCKAPAVLEDVYSTVLDIAGIEAPGPVDSNSLVPWCRGETPEWPAWVHGEHSTCYDEDNAVQFLTDGTWKYVWYPTTGRQQLFNLERDPDELHDLSDDADSADELATWRGRLVEKLAARPEDGLSDGTDLIANGSPPSVRPHLQDPES
ncbi:MAG: sulfatase-like hydrolase/transferase, partial [Planctomycetota bacterium]